MLVSTNSVRLNPRNPNTMKPEFRRKLRASIEANGGKYPALDVREISAKPEAYEMLDGEQRFGVLLDMGKNEVEVTNWGTVSDADADRLIVTLNRLRGEDDLDRRASIIARLMKSFPSMTDLAILIPENPNSINKLLGRAEGGATAALAASLKDAAKTDPTKPQKLTFILYADAAKVVEQALERVIAEAELTGDKNARNRALEFLASEYLAGS